MTKKQSARNEFYLMMNDFRKCFELPILDAEETANKAITITKKLWNWIENHVEEEKKKAQIDILEEIVSKPSFNEKLIFHCSRELQIKDCGDIIRNKLKNLKK